MKFFRILKDKDTHPTGSIDGVSQWSTPSIECSVCGGYGGGLGEAYPTVKLSDFPERTALEESRSLQAVSLEEYRRLHTLPRCGRNGNRFPVEAPVLNAVTLPEDVDNFRLRDFTTILIANERFVDAVRRLRLGDIVFRELPVQ